MTAAAITRPVLCGMCGTCAVCLCGIKPAWILGCAVCAVSTATRAGGRANGHHAQNTQNKTALSHGTDTAHTAHTAHPLRIKHLHDRHTAHPYPTYRTKEKMTEKQAKAVIRCTPENAAEVRDLVKRWPELDSLVRGLQAQGMFPGLRALQITLTGSEEQVAKGLAGVMAESAPQAICANPTEKARP